jgi:hypothetical protein
MPQRDPSDRVFAADTYHWCARDPLIDWLNRSMMEILTFLRQRGSAQLADAA